MNEVIFDKNDTYEYEHNICKRVFREYFSNYENEREDFIQEAWFETMKAKKKYNGKYTYFAYIHKIARNVMLLKVIHLNRFKRSAMNDYESLDMIVGENREDTLGDIMPGFNIANSDINAKLMHDIIIKICEKVSNRKKNKEYKDVLNLVAKEYNLLEISDKLKLSYSNLLFFYRNHLKNEIYREMAINGFVDLRDNKKLKADIITLNKFINKKNRLVSDICKLYVQGYSASDIIRELDSGEFITRQILLDFKLKSKEELKKLKNE